MKRKKGNNPPQFYQVILCRSFYFGKQPLRHKSILRSAFGPVSPILRLSYRQSSKEYRIRKQSIQRMYDIIFQSLCQPLMYALTAFFVFYNVFCRKEFFFPPISEIKRAEFIFFHRIFPLCRFNKPGVKQHFQISVFPFRVPHKRIKQTIYPFFIHIARKHYSEKVVLFKSHTF